MKRMTGLFVRVSLEVHQDDRFALEEIARGMLVSRGRSLGHLDTADGADEREYRLVIVPRFRKAGAKPHQIPRGFKTFTLPDGEAPWVEDDEP